MYPEHNRPEGPSQGYFCYRCGEVTNMVGTGHDDCVPNPPLVKELILLNQSSKKEKKYGTSK